jgi:nitroimidazol reductase NimA-like FMN-containing flavoprotein (pyridoxamine 5'-phosphate oxidase superfamily)
VRVTSYQLTEHEPVAEQRREEKTMPSPERPGLPGWQRFIGRWVTEGAHPLLPGQVIRGYTTFEWLDGQQFVIQRSHYDHPDIPDAIAIIGATGEQLSMHYFDRRGIHRVYAVSLEADQWRFWRDDPGFRQEFTGHFSADGDTITGQGQMDRDGSGWEDDLALTYRRSPAGSGPPMGHADLNAMARRVIDANHYMTLATTDPDGRPRLSPVYYTPARYSDFYWVSAPGAQHSLNLAERPEAEIVIFDSSAPANRGEAVYLTATVTEVPDDQLETIVAEAFRTTAGARPFTPGELRDGALRLYVAHLRSCEVHVAAQHPVHGRGTDTRQPADPNSAADK